MAATKRILSYGVLMGVMALTSACVIREHGNDAAAREQGYREGYYDREHSRYWHDHSWHECRDHDDFCH